MQLAQITSLLYPKLQNSTIGRTSPATQNDVFDSNWERSFGFHPPGGLTLCERNSLLISRVKLPSTYNPEEDQETCPICIEGFLPGQSVIFLPCCHKIHKACFWKLSKDYRCCSICKMDMSKGIHYRNQFFNWVSCCPNIKFII